MKVITKRADELKPGDMLAWNGMAGRVVVSTGKQSGNSVELVTQGADSATATTFISAASQLLVATLELTPAQQHADALLALVEALPATPDTTALLDKIRPPVAPTMAEVLNVLGVLAEGHSAAGAQKAKEIIARANRAAASGRKDK